MSVADRDEQAFINFLPFYDTSTAGLLKGQAEQIRTWAKWLFKTFVKH